MNGPLVPVTGEPPEGMINALVTGGPLQLPPDSEGWAVVDPAPAFIDANWPDGRPARYVLQGVDVFHPRSDARRRAHYVDPWDWRAGRATRETAFRGERRNDRPRLVLHQSLRAAQEDPNGAVVYASEYGGVVTLTAPAKVVDTDLVTLVRLGSDLDAVQMMYGDWTIATLTFESHAAGKRIPHWGRMGSDVLPGEYIDLPEPIFDQAVDVIHGKRARIDADLLRETRNRKLARMKRRRLADGFYAGMGFSWDCDICPPLIPFTDNDPRLVL